MTLRFSSLSLADVTVRFPTGGRGLVGHEIRR